ncbi:MAG: lysophospholipid acyltransferase family protein [Phycisphaerales bacterium]|nr:lysophospholipid acyltransferase family protein [Phycisphaerales bacterium]
MGSTRTPLRNLAEYIPARALASVIRCFPPERNQSTADLAATIYARCTPRRTARATDNVKRSMPHLSDRQAQQLAVDSICHLFRLALMDAMQMDRVIHPDRWWHHLDIRQASRARAVLMGDRPAILVTGHLGNWELLGFALSMLGVKLHALARPLDNPLLNRWLLGIREAWGLKVLTKFGAAPRMQAILDRGEHLAFIADQNAGDRGMFVPFFGRLASAYKSIALLAITQKLPVVVAGAFRVKRGIHYRLEVQEVIEPEQWSDHDNPVYWLTARYTWGLEQLVKRHPSQYLWLHRRWKSRPRHERNGTEMSAALERRIRGLDWLDASEQDGVIQRSNAEAIDGPGSNN